jgi:acetolactate synthase-1/2/3 large subunit
VETVADVLVEVLREAQIGVVFGLPGGENVEVLDALRRGGIRFVLVHNEPSAVFMADATARLTGSPGVCLTTLGPGATNAVAGVAHAYLDRAPVLVITAQKPDRLLPDYTHQVIDLNALFTPITKRSVKLRPEGARETVRRALDLATAGRPGPVHLQISNDDAEEGPYEALRELAEAAGAPVITTPKSKGSLPADHPLAAGTIGLTSRDPAYDILYEANCVVAVGLDVVELVKPWDIRSPLIWVAPWANEDPQLPAHAELVGLT